MVHLTTEILSPSEDNITKAANLLRNGQLVSFPTETVYGLGADATNDDAVAGIYAAKGRPSFNPLIAHVATIEAAQRYVYWSDDAQRVADAFWPGPLTIVLPLRPDSGISPIVTAGLDSLALRLPAHPLAQSLLQHVDRPVAAPSANPSGRISPTTAQHVFAGLNGKLAAILDGGPCAVGLESTIIGLVNTPTLLRPGGITQADLQAALGRSIDLHSAQDAISAPGQMVSHYAPSAQVRLNATSFAADELGLGFGSVECDLNLSPTGNLVEAASNLFSMLHLLDHRNSAKIAVSPIPSQGIGAAINDRLNRAAAPRD